MVTLSEVVRFKGHAMVRATHPTTIEITKDKYLTPRGDCIVGVSSDKGVADLSEPLKRAIASGRKVTVTLEAGGIPFKFTCSGDPRLSFESRSDMVIRRSSYICGRTLAISADVAAAGIPREIVGRLRRPGCDGSLRIEVE